MKGIETCIRCGRQLDEGSVVESQIESEYGELCHSMWCNKCNKRWYACFLCAYYADKKSNFQRHCRSLTHMLPDQGDIADTVMSDCVNEHTMETNVDFDTGMDLITNEEEYSSDESPSAHFQTTIDCPVASQIPQGQCTQLSLSRMDSLLDSSPCSFHPQTLHTYLNDKDSVLYFTSMAKGTGANAIIAKAFSRRDGESSSIPTEEEVNFHLIHTKFCHSLTRSQLETYCYILRTVVSNPIVAKETVKDDIFQKTNIPTEINDISKIYLNGSSSIVKSAPHPTIHAIDNHAVVRIKDVIAHVLAQGLKLEDIVISGNTSIVYNPDDPVTKFTESKYMMNLKMTLQENLDGDTVLLLNMTEWSDDFDPNSIKRNKGSIWIKTLTVSLPSDDNETVVNTYPIALGLKGDSHLIAEEFFRDEIAEFHSTNYMYFYYGKLRKVIKVKPVVTVSAQDRVERSSSNCILSHKGTYAARWLYSANLGDKNMVAFFPSCDICYKRRTNFLLGKSPRDVSSYNLCPKCADWNINSESSKLWFQKPKDYPFEKARNSPDAPPGRDVMALTQNKLRPVKLSFEFLKKALDFACFNLHKKSWTSKQAECYLNVCCVAPKFRTSVFQNLKEQKDITDFSQLKLIYPPTWNRKMKLTQHIDTVMHLVFLGVGKKTLDLVDSALKSVSKRTPFIKHKVNPQLAEIRSLSLNWMHAIPFSGNDMTTGSWVSENYLGYTRLLKYVCFCLKEYYRPNEEDEMGIEVLRLSGDAMHALHYMIIRIMEKKATKLASHHMLESIKYFLSAVDKIDTHVRPERDTPQWVQAGNFVSLLNLPDFMLEFGPLVNFWEGGAIGEKFIQEVNHHINGKVTGENWKANTLEKIYEHKALDLLIRQNHADKGIGVHYDRYTEYHTYKNFQ